MKWVVRRGDAAVENGKMHTSLSMEPVPSSATTRPAFPVVAFMMCVCVCGGEPSLAVRADEASSQAVNFKLLGVVTDSFQGRSEHM